MPTQEVAVTVGGESVSAFCDVSVGGSSAVIGPSGQWPAGFPAYTTAADVVTDGTSGALNSALTSLAATGGVIEHAGNITGTRTRSGTAEILIRPPLGQRAEYSLGAGADLIVAGSGLLFAGWKLGDQVRISNAVNSGLAWCEGDPDVRIQARATSTGSVCEAFLCEVVCPTYKSSGDRIRIDPYGTNSTAHLNLVGCWLAGSAEPPPAHADTIQVVNQNGGLGTFTATDCVIFASWDKAIQGNGNNDIFDLENCWIADPTESNVWFPGEQLDGFHAITSVGEMNNCTLLGSVNSGFAVTVTNSVTYLASGFVDGGGNTTTFDYPEPPAVKSHTELDSIWST